ncbi:hypothetical protein ATY41_05460 [Leifsonia xyli subsp. xyli]|uniref:Uncharacterized protein n=2 Tax=Leifsonia xyli subsp. xyli TaxID=59736 RepID=Q6AFM9_LEIXX|nr:hypothetical protein [Leifsonia xyli]AAT88816.1 hypothetical protein Lxx09270 [Leifsonia xyli subsp. xyli str. CTCB07]ODA89532.1 hypothetical protein ATY41_05460 [Leifsonia xyli subsp. xyli]
MALALAPRIQRVWRSPNALQFGIDAPVLVLDPFGTVEERMLAALASGVSLGVLEVVARTAGGAPGAAAQLLGLLGPLIVERNAGGVSESGSPPRRPPMVVVDGGRRTAEKLGGMLREGGVAVREAGWPEPPREGPSAGAPLGPAAPVAAPDGVTAPETPIATADHRRDADPA